MASDNGPFTLTDKGVAIAVRLQPGASRSGIDGPVTLDDGKTVLKARVSEPPENGKANAALIRLLAKTWHLPKSSIEIQCGRSERRKTLLVAGGDRDRLTALQGWLQETGRRQRP